MSYKLKQESIEGFSRKVAKTICDRFFASNKRAKGADLMGFTDSKQVNAFLVKILFEKWQEETESLKSPYFDFDHGEVKEALRKFMNKLSEFISVRQDDLEPLLETAIHETVLITFDPAAYVRKVVAESGSLSKKYIKVRKQEFKELSSLSGVSSSDFEEESPVSPEDFVESLGADLNDLFEEESVSFFDQQDDFDDEEEEFLPTLEEPTGEEDTIVDPEEDSEIETVLDSVSEKLEEPGETINERFTNNGKVETLADKLKKSKKQSLEASLNLNERIMFINSLFGGNKEQMSAALTDLEQADNYDQAKMKAYKYSENWDMESEEVEAFFEVIERRFV